jgi:hypothetical protein
LSEDLKCEACGELHSNARYIRTEDGRLLALQSEAFARYCLARWVLKKYRSKRTRQAFLGKWREDKGDAEWARLRGEMLLIYNHRQAKPS